MYKGFNKVYDKTLGAYVKAITYFLRKPVITMSLFLILSVGSLWLFLRWPTSFIPQEDQGYFVVSVQLPNAANLQRTEEVSRKIMKMLDSYPEVRT